MNKDYYSELGVSKDASPEEIRAAYRRKARGMHPDRKGGEHDEMAQLNRAKSTLLDPVRRLTYDKTGQDRPKPVDLNAREIVVDHCKMFLGADSEGDMLQAVRGGIAKNMLAMKDQVKKIHITCTKSRARLQRIKRKKKGESFLHTMLNFELSRLEQSLEQIREKISFHKRALELLDDYETESEIVGNPGFLIFTDQLNGDL